jgi:peptidoglycan/LPS O-acetylase OafA/YrhL
VARLAHWGSSTTSFFFILSGFILAHAYAGGDGRLRIAAGEFWRRRFARLVPMAILGHLLVVPLIWGLYAPGERWPRLAAAFTGTQAWFPRLGDSFDTPAWVISALLFFCLLFPFALRAAAGWGRGRLRAVLAVLLGAMLLGPTLYVLASPVDAGFWKAFLHYFPLVRLAEFLFGIVLARLFAVHGGVRAPRWLAPAALAVLVAGLVLLSDSLYPLARNGLFAPVHAALIWGVGTSSGAVARLLGSRPMRPLGDASFPLFLLHVPVFAWMTYLLDAGSFGAAAGTVFYLTFVVVAVVLSLLADRWIADPIEARIRRGATPKPAAVPIPARLAVIVPEVPASVPGA